MKVSRGIEPAQMAFSAESFGPGERQRRVCEHIRKELAEIDADPDDLNEWTDVLTLALDDAWRQCVHRHGYDAGEVPGLIARAGRKAEAQRSPTVAGVARSERR